MKQLFTWLIALLVSLGSVAQDQAVIDSLEQALPSLQGRERVDGLCKLAYQFYRSTPERTFELAKEARQLAGTLNYTAGYSKAYGMLGTYYFVMSDLDSVELYFNASLKAAREINDAELLAEAWNRIGVLRYYTSSADSTLAALLRTVHYLEQLDDESRLSSVLNNIASTYSRQAEYEKSLSYFMRVLEIDEKANNRYGIARVKGNIGGVHFELGQFETALQYHTEALEIQREINDVVGQGFALMNIGNVYIRLKQWPEAEEALRASLRIWVESANVLQESASRNNLGAMFQDMDKLDSALTHFQHALKLKEGLNDVEGLASTHGNIGYLYLKSAQYAKAEESLRRSIALCDSMGSSNYLDENYMNLAQALAAQGRIDEAMEAASAALAVKDSVFDAELKQSVAELETQYQTEKQARENLKLRTENAESKLALTEATNQRNALVAVVLVLVLMALLTFSWLRQRAQQRRQLERIRQEQERLSAVILGQEAERKRIASELHDGIGQLLSAVKLQVSSLANESPSSEKLETVLQMTDDAVREVRHISHAMMPNVLVKKGLVAALEEMAARLSLSDSFEVEVDVGELPKKLPEAHEIHLFRVVQELLNNIIKYAGATEVHVQLDQEGNVQTLMLEDNGRGFDATRLDQSNGNGWHNIKSRLQLLKGSIEFDTNVNRSGTVVFIEVPLD